MLALRKTWAVFTVLFTFTISFTSSAQIVGCMDPLSTNFNPLAVLNDGSCTYAVQSISPTSSVLLSDTLQETSGLIQWNNEIWTHNDNTDTNLYQINPVNGSVAQRISLPNIENTDWEEISQDADYVYLGDFGNNALGNRTDLHILRIGKISMANGTPDIDTISFNYSNQSSFIATAGNATNFDCEAFVVSSDSIYLFTKRWIDKKTFLYAMAKTPGNHTALLRDSLNVQGLITGATYLEDKKLLAICGYTSALQPFIYAFYDFMDFKFFSGNKRKFGVSLSYTQIEGITTRDGLTYYMSNEKFVSGPANIPQKLHVFDMTPYFHSYLTADIHEIEDQVNFHIYPNPASDEINLISAQSIIGKLYFVVDASGRKVKTGVISSAKLSLNGLNRGTYILQAEGFVDQKFVIE